MIDKPQRKCSIESMIGLAPTITEPRASGVVYTSPWMVDLVLDLAGYVPNRPLAKMLAMEPSAGDGAFLVAMVSRLIESCTRHGTPVSDAEGAIQAFEIDPTAAKSARKLVEATLVDLKIEALTARRLSNCWVKTGDFLESSLGFSIADFVIGNPPYIRMEEIPEKKASMYRSRYDTMRGRADIYVAFYQAALMQLKRGGVCAFICADRWMLNDYGSALRSFITAGGYNVRNIIECHDVPAFETEVSAYPAVTIIACEPQGPVIVSKALPGIETESRPRLIQALASPPSSLSSLRSARFDDWFRGTEPWPCSSPDSLKLLKLLENTCLPLESSHTVTKIGIGVATGADRVFISRGEPDIETDRILPLAHASDLENGKVRSVERFLANPWNENGLVPLANYPRLSRHLGAHHDVLAERHTARKDRPENWHKTIDRVNIGLITKEKLYIADIKDRLLPALDTGETYPHHNLYWITSEGWDLKVLGALLMSDVGQFFIQCYGVRMRGGYLRFQAQYLRRIRVPEPQSISPKLAKTLRLAFETQDFRLATTAAFEAYKIDKIPE